MILKKIHEIHKKICKTDCFPIFIKAPVVVLSSWIFQGLLYMDATERFFKILLNALLFFPFYLIFKIYAPTILSIVLALVLAHTLNWIFNGKIFVALKHLKVTKTQRKQFIQYLVNLKRKVKKENSILAVATFGSLSRKELKNISDLDVKIIRKPGIVNGFRSCFFVFLEKSKASLSKFPLDIYVLDSANSLLKEGTPPKILYDPNKVFGSNKIKRHFKRLDINKK